MRTRVRYSEADRTEQRVEQLVEDLWNGWEDTGRPIDVLALNGLLTGADERVLDDLISRAAVVADDRLTADPY